MGFAIVLPEVGKALEPHGCCSGCGASFPVAQGRLFPMDPITLLGYNKAKSAQKELGMHGNHGRAFLSVPPPPLISAREGQPCPKRSGTAAPG